MELDDLKLAWQSLDRQLETQNALNLQLLRERKLDQARGSLRPLYWGQLLQIPFGLAFVALASLLWMSAPQHASTVVAGIVVHAYGVITLICAGMVLGQIGKIDYAAPVVEIQKQLARLRRLYVRTGMFAGLPWWFLWVPLLMTLAGLGDVDLLARAPGLVWGGLAGGAAGLLATAWFHRWSRHPSRPHLARAMDDAVAGDSLRRAQAALDEVLRFERE